MEIISFNEEVKIRLTLFHCIFERLVCTIVRGVLQTLFYLFLIRQGLSFPLCKFSIKLNVTPDIPRTEAQCCSRSQLPGTESVLPPQMMRSLNATELSLRCHQVQFKNIKEVTLPVNAKNTDCKFRIFQNATAHCYTKTQCCKNNSFAGLVARSVIGSREPALGHCSSRGVTVGYLTSDKMSYPQVN